MPTHGADPVPAASDLAVAVAPPSLAPWPRQRAVNSLRNAKARPWSRAARRAERADCYWSVPRVLDTHLYKMAPFSTGSSGGCLCFSGDPQKDPFAITARSFSYSAMAITRSQVDNRHGAHSHGVVAFGAFRCSPYRCRQSRCALYCCAPPACCWYPPHRRSPSPSLSRAVAAGGWVWGFGRPRLRHGELGSRQRWPSACRADAR